MSKRGKNESRYRRYTWHNFYTDFYPSLSLAFLYYKHKPNTPKANHVTHTLYKYELNFSSDFKI